MPDGINKGIEAVQAWREKATPEQLEAVEEKRKETRRKNKQMRDVALYILNAELLDDDEISEELDRLGADRTYQDAILFNIAKKAKDYGDVEAMRFLRDTSGQKPTENMAIGNFEGDALRMSLSELTDAQLLEMIAKRQSGS